MNNKEVIIRKINSLFDNNIYETIGGSISLCCTLDNKYINILFEKLDNSNMYYENIPKIIVNISSVDIDSVWKYADITQYNQARKIITGSNCYNEYLKNKKYKRTYPKNYKIYYIMDHVINLYEIGYSFSYSSNSVRLIDRVSRNENLVRDAINLYLKESGLYELLIKYLK